MKRWWLKSSSHHRGGDPVHKHLQILEPIGVVTQYCRPVAESHVDCHVHSFRRREAALWSCVVPGERLQDPALHWGETCGRRSHWSGVARLRVKNHYVSEELLLVNCRREQHAVIAFVEFAIFITAICSAKTLYTKELLVLYSTLTTGAETDETCS